MSDFAYVAGRASAAVVNGALEAGVAAAALYYHGNILAEQDDQVGARASWSSAAELAPGSSHGRAAAAAIRAADAE